MSFSRWTALFTVGCVLYAPLIAARGIDVNLTSSWPSSVFYPLLETSEFLAEENPLYFWRYVDALDKRQDEIARLTQATDGNDVDIDAITQFAVDLAQEVAPNTRNILDLMVSTRAYSVKIEMFRQLALDSGIRPCGTNVEAWAVMYKENRCITAVACSAADVSSALAQASTASNTCIAAGINDVALAVDHTYISPFALNEDATTVILYGLLGSSSFYSFHRVLEPLANTSGTINYIVRHYPKESTLPTLLQGYGVSLDIKNMEYKTIDDSKKATLGENGGDVDDEDGEDELSRDDDQDSDEASGQTSAEEEDVDGLLFTKLMQQHPSIQNELKQFRNFLVQQDQEQEIKAWHLKDIGMSATREILDAKNPLKRLQILSQDFPKHAKKLAFSRKPLSEELRQEIEVYRSSATEHHLMNRLLLNGLLIDPMQRSFNIFDLINTLRKEWSLAKALAALPLSKEERNTMLRHVVQNKMERGAVRIRVRGPLDGTAPFYLNNINKDHATKGWPASVETLVRPAWNLIFIRTNMYENVVVLDPLSVHGRQALNQLTFLRMRGAPLQWGLLLSTKELLAAKTSEARTAIVNKYKQVELTEKATGWHYAKLLFMVKAKESADPGEKYRGRLVSAYMAGVADELGEITLQQLMDCYLDATGGSFTKATSLLEAMETVRKDFALDAAVMSMTEYIAKKHLPFEVHLFNGVLNRHLDLQSDIMKHLGRDQALYQTMARKGELEDDMDFVDELLTSQNAYPTYFSIFDQGDEDEGSHEGSAVVADGPHAARTHLFANDENHHLETLVNAYVVYLHQQGTLTIPKKQTLMVVADLSDRVHAAHALEVVKAVRGVLGREMRVGVIHRVSSTATERSLGGLVAALIHVIGHSDRDVYTKLVEEALRCVVKGKTVQAATTKLIGLIQKSPSWENAAILKQLDTIVGSNKGSFLNGTAQTSLSQLNDALHAAHGSKRVAKTNEKPPAQLFLNGFRIDLPEDPISDEDISALMRFDMKYRSLPIAKAFIKRSAKFTAEQAHERSMDIVKASAIMDKYRQSDRYPSLEHTNSTLAITLPGDEALQVHAYVDPVSEAAQRISALLVMLRTQFNTSIELFPLPSSDHSEFPVQRFYRYLFATKRAHATKVQFRKLPIKPILTMKIDTPEAWNVQIRRSVEDLDNLRVDTDSITELLAIKSASFRLESLLLYGQCRDKTFDMYAPPNGLQLVLERTVGAFRLHRDTLVMKNLGYFQLQATPGIWSLQLARGRATELFEIVDMETDQALESTDYMVSDFTSRLQQLMVRKRVGKEHEELLVSDEESGSSKHKSYGEVEPIAADAGLFASYWRSMVSFLSGSEIKGSTGEESALVSSTANQGRTGETIHVFSLASGHLYERFLKIMMSSVLKRTQNPVTFWLLENFLSPDFKDSIPALRQQFGMDIRLVTYKWPNWLRQQTQKQRIIWGYKILFLDVLFPLGVPKIIYVDADQVVRADLKELWEMDLHGAPYGYTPFCDSRNVGFQFWRQGYWKDHLRGRPYHISALYVVDLTLFRQIAAGDMLRAIYDQLSADPNSLSNLDQDLPNYAQHQIRIFSLPQEWLWCESWCSDETKVQAKTIDLCNNPKHKEPKLEMAKRVISGQVFKESWVELDAGIKQAEETYKKIQAATDSASSTTNDEVIL